MRAKEQQLTSAQKRRDLFDAKHLESRAALIQDERKSPLSLLATR